MSKHEQMSPHALARATLDFVRETDKFYLKTQTHSGRGFNLPRYDKLVKAEIAANQEEVNHNIRALGGLPLTIIDESGFSARCFVDAWLGYDPDPADAGNHLWHIEGMPPSATLSIGPSAIDEMEAALAPLDGQAA